MVTFKVDKLLNLCTHTQTYF